MGVCRATAGVLTYTKKDLSQPQEDKPNTTRLPVVHQPRADRLHRGAGQDLEAAGNLAEGGEGLAPKAEGGHGAEVPEAGDLARVVLEGERL